MTADLSNPDKMLSLLMTKVIKQFPNINEGTGKAIKRHSNAKKKYIYHPVTIRLSPNCTVNLLIRNPGANPWKVAVSGPPGSETKNLKKISRRL